MLNEVTTPLAAPRAQSAHAPEWLGMLAKVVVVLAFVVVVAGSAVTSTRSGDADPAWPSFGGAALPSVTEMSENRGLFFEHGHRLIAGTTGLVTLGFAVAVWLAPERRRWVQWLGTAAGVVVIILAVLGGVRVKFKQIPELGIVHVSVAMVFISLCATLAAVTGNRWRSGAAELESGKGITSEEATWLSLASLGCAAAVYLQAVLGAVPRHLYVGASAHILWAFAVFTIVVLVSSRVLSKHSHLAGVFRPAMALLFLTLIQFFLGFTTYVYRPEGRKAPGSGFFEWIASAHLAVGALILISSVVLTARAFRLRWQVRQGAIEPAAQAVPA
jgi:cytochrome c oxidase assembly protein subunit 15